MTEEERAEYYDQHRDDPQVWAEIEDAFHVPTRARRQGGLTTTVTVRFDPDDAAKLRLLAERLNVSYSDVVREAVRQIVRPRFVMDLREQNVDFTVHSEKTVGGQSIPNPFAATETRTGSSRFVRKAG